MKLLHRHRWQIVQSFVMSRNHVWPPMWACPCEKMRDMQSMDDWGLY